MKPVLTSNLCHLSHSGICGICEIGGDQGAGRCASRISYDVGFDCNGTLRALRIKGAMLAGAIVDLADQDIAILKSKADMVLFQCPNCPLQSRCFQ